MAAFLPRLKAGWRRLRQALAPLSLLALLALPTAGSTQEFLDPAVAFKASARALDGSTVEIHFTIARGYYLYRDKLRFATPPDSGLSFGAPRLPPGKEKVDDTFGRVVVYFNDATIRLPVSREAGTDASASTPLSLTVTSQGCAEAGICYPPQQQTLTLQLPPPAATDGAALADDSPRVDGSDESGRIARLLKDASFFGVLASFFGFGLLLSLTPCMLPMLPILSGIIVGSRGAQDQTQTPGRGRALALSLAYVFGMALTYAVAGVAAGLTGTLLSSALQTPWALGGFALVFVVLAGAMFGFYELQLPSALQSRASASADRVRGGSLPGVALMGALSAVIVGPCVAAPLAGALLYIGQTGDAALGGAALFAMALGMGVPLLVVGASAGALLPKAGPWMQLVNKAFGIILLAVAAWLVSPLLPAAALLATWGILLIVPAVYLHALDPLPPHAKGGRRLAKGLALVALLYGVALLVGAWSGARDPLQPLAGLRGESAPATLPFVRVASVSELDVQIADAAAHGRPVMLDFYADWCVVCKEMERDTFADARIRARLAGWTLLQADVTANNTDDKALLQRFHLYGPPGTIFFNTAGQEIAGGRVVGYQDAPTFLRTLDRVGPAPR
ncbi:protein-disulfide reductase DsbD [Rhodocyclus tenuis]|uniref:protein-disulfide reductase DsbD n=1 Tax=Rhodocyclus gracilis TaxID=2929842 RepID=UPI001298C710|nr:protein-disulfide reductase DsbD [Rhodocyclus gracilis]MRD73422.1 protein-disulfide reductase DsbD [Rhodocyclus gracilis]